jgi:hypothetical protein
LTSSLAIIDAASFGVLQYLMRGAKSERTYFAQEAQEDVGIAHETDGRTESRFNRVEAQPRSLAGKLQRRGEGALFLCRIGVQAQRVLRSAHRRDPGVVEQAHNRQIERDLL